jgi:hypothetical protein
VAGKFDSGDAPELDERAAPAPCSKVLRSDGEGIEAIREDSGLECDLAARPKEGEIWAEIVWEYAIAGETANWETVSFLAVRVLEKRIRKNSGWTKLEVALDSPVDWRILGHT